MNKTKKGLEEEVLKEKTKKTDSKEKVTDNQENFDNKNCCHDEDCCCHEDNCHDEDCCCNEEAISEVDILKDMLLRNQAEFQNFRRRTKEETNKMLKYSNEEIAKDLLEIVDDFGRAITMNNDDKNDKFLNGFKMIYANTIELLKKYEIVEIDAYNKPFDSKYHDAVMTDVNKDFESGIVLEVLRKGYMLKDKVIRPAMVKVNE